MLFFIITLASLSLASGRTFRPRLPGGLSHSIVNLGKMDFNVYLNTKPESPKYGHGMIQTPKPLRSLQTEDVPTCPCQQKDRRSKNVDHDDTQDLLMNVLMGVDPRFKETANSMLCCTSEETQEEVILEFKPPVQPFHAMRQSFPAIPARFPPRPSMFSTIRPRFPPIPRFQMSPNVPPLIFPLDEMFSKQLTGAGTIFIDEVSPGKIMNLPDYKKIEKIEIFVDPKRKTRTTRLVTTTPASTLDIRAVGEKKTTMLYDLMSTNLSVKKDLAQDIGGRYKDVETLLLPKSTGTFNNTNTL